MGFSFQFLERLTSYVFLIDFSFMLFTILHCCKRVKGIIKGMTSIYYLSITPQSFLCTLLFQQSYL